MKLVSLMAIAFTSTAAAQTANSHECLADSLLSTQANSITTRFNDKVVTFRVTPATEIWRRGVDLESPLQLVPGDHIYVKCAGTPAADGSPIATLIAAPQAGNGVDMEPHRITETTVCMGRLADIGADTLTLKNDKGSCAVRITPATRIWRGQIYPDTSALKIGDQVGSRCVIAYPSGELIAESVEANVAKTEGKIVSVRPDRIVVQEFRWRHQITVLIDSRTKCDDCAAADLKKGVDILATGLALAPDNDRTFRATYLTVEK